MLAYITFGAKSSHGGTFITGSPYNTHNGVPVARLGDKAIYKKVVTILSGAPYFIIDSGPIARHGDVTLCGFKLIAIQQSFVEADFEIARVEPL